ncbi:MAG: hypothetical protein M1308_04745 [Actinobacteria bacterium]|nr:hypothetical protein [Actinomycetota bacterium]
MSLITSTLADFITYLNTLYNSSSTAPVSGDEDYTVWTSLANIAVNIWENEEGMLWNELFVKLADAPNGTKTTTIGNYSYTVPTLFRFPAGGYVWLGDNTNKTAYKIIKAQDLQLYENDSGNWCYFLMDGTPTLEFNPNLTFSKAQTINYAYYKKATKLTTGTDSFEMSDPMFAVYFILAELKKEEGNTAELQIASQKLNAMKTLNEMPSWLEEYSLTNKTEGGFG